MKDQVLELKQQMLMLHQEKLELHRRLRTQEYINDSLFSIILLKQVQRVFPEEKNPRAIQRNSNPTLPLHRY